MRRRTAPSRRLTRAIDLGITYIDTAHSYGNGKSEERIGKLMARAPGQVTLATKLSARKADDARRQIELSLKRLRTDRLDVLHIHALPGRDDLAAIEAPGGVLEALYEAREQKVARAIGITCHADPAALATALERHDFDCTQMALNAAMARMAERPGGMKATPMPRGSFEELALPVAVRKGMGVIAMKVFGQDQIIDAAPIEKLLTYALSLPVSLASLRHAEARVHRPERRARAPIRADVRSGAGAAEGFDHGRAQALPGRVLPAPRGRLIRPS